FQQLGALHGLDVLDYGCGHGMAAVVLARRGARLTAFDLSPGYLYEARRRAEANGVTIHFAQADGEHLPFTDGSFDASGAMLCYIIWMYERQAGSFFAS